MSVSVIPDLIPDFDDAVDPRLEAAPVADVERLSDVRADVPITETSERFLRALLLQVPIERVVELYLFAPLRQGAVETGIAVIAARVHAPATGVIADSIADGEPADISTPQVVADEALVIVAAPDSDATTIAKVSAAEALIEEEIGGVIIVDTISDDGVEEIMIIEGASNAETDEEGNVDGNEGENDVQAALTSDEYDHDDSPYAPEPELDAEQLEPVDVLYDVPPPVRHTVYTARYRLVIKGPDRGKWEIDVVDEADAPLLAVETVVRGVQRRAGEETATVRYDAGQLSRALRLQPSENL